MEKLIIFADYGLDDAAATASILKNRNKFDSITIVPIGGNVPTDVSFQNCITLLNELGETGLEIVDTTKIKQPYEYLKDIHGQDGMGDIFEKHKDTEGLDITEFNEWINTLSGSETILSLGPMTLVYPVLEKYKNKKLVIMGGCIKHTPNYKGYEFNHGLDPEAFSKCVKFPHIAITLDTCSVKALDMNRYSIEETDKYSKILLASKRMSKSYKDKNCYVYDDIAACFILHPERFETQTLTDPFGNLVTNGIYVSSKPQFEE